MFPRSRSRHSPKTDLESKPLTKIKVVDHGGDVQRRKRFKPILGWVIVAILMAWRPLELMKLPSWIINLLFLAGAGFVAHGLATFRRWNDELRTLPLFVKIFGAAILELAIENYCVWVVSAGNTRKYDETFRPLQDNVAIVAEKWMEQSALITHVVTWHWAHIANFLLVFLSVPFSCLWDQVPYSGFAIASRALLMHIIVRTVRTLSFLAVVLPNSRTPSCYKRRFPPVPDDMWNYILTGITTLKGFGGCNDLILSGHACTWMMTVMTVWTYYPYGLVKYVVVLAYIQTSLRTSVEGWHYSVDFIIPAVLSAYVWRDIDWVCPQHTLLQGIKPGTRDPISTTALIVICAAIAFCTIVAFYVGA